MTLTRNNKHRAIAKEKDMPISIEDIIEKAFEQAFAQALEQVIQKQAETLFDKVFAEGSPLAAKLEKKIEDGFRAFVEHGIQWEKKRPGFKK